MKEEAVTSQATERVDFETAIAACGFGSYNICLLLVCTPAMAAALFETTSISYILPIAECDLELSLIDKGLLNAITYAGMIMSAILWGYLADTVLGRKRLLVYGLLLEGLCTLCASLSQNLTQLLIFKFFGGAIACGPYAVIMSYISEMHCKEHRSGIMMTTGMIKNTASLALPIMAWAILPHSSTLEFFTLKVRSWQVFLALTATPSIISGLLLFLFPESPKFLMSQGRNEEAMEVFKTIYSWNSRKAKATYEVKSLMDEIPRQNPTEPHKGISRSLSDGRRQMKPLFQSPYLRLSLLVYTLHFCLLMGQNSIRLWLPQIFASIEEYELQKLGSPSMCNILAYNVQKTTALNSKIDDVNTTCEVHVTQYAYVNNVIAAASGFVGSLLASVLVKKVGNKRILCCSIAVTLALGVSFYFASSTVSFVVQSSLFVTISSVAITSVISASVNIFPTTMRTMVVVLVQTFGRLGALLGNVLFPILMTAGCIQPFLLVAGVLLVGFLISLFLPDSTKLSLQ